MPNPRKPLFRRGEILRSVSIMFLTAVAVLLGSCSPKMCTYLYKGIEYPLYKVPLPDGTKRDLVLIEKGRSSSRFVDPKDPNANPIEWEGTWRALTPTCSAKAIPVSTSRDNQIGRGITAGILAGVLLLLAGVFIPKQKCANCGYRFAKILKKCPKCKTPSHTTFSRAPDIKALATKANRKGLIKALSYGNDASVRKAAAEALGKIGDGQAVEPLIDILWDSDENVRQATARALGAIGMPAVTPLITLLKHEFTSMPKTGAIVWDQRRIALRKILIEIGTPAVPALMAALQLTSEMWGVRMEAAYALGDIGDVQAREPLKIALMDVQQEIARTQQQAAQRPELARLLPGVMDSLQWYAGAIEYALNKIGNA